MQVQWKIHETNETTSLPQLVSCVCQDLSPCKSRWTDLRRFKTDATWFNQISSKEKNILKKGNHDMTYHDKFIDNSKKHTWVERSWVWVSIASHNRRYSLLRSSISWKWSNWRAGWHGWHVIFIRQPGSPSDSSLAFGHWLLGSPSVSSCQICPVSSEQSRS